MLRALAPWLFCICLGAAALSIGVEWWDPIQHKWLTMVVIPMMTSIGATLLAFLFGYEEVAKRMSTLREDRTLGPIRRFWGSADPSKGWVIVSSGDIPESIDGKPQDMSLETLFSWGVIKDTLLRLYGGAVAIEYKQASAIKDWAQLKGKNLVFLGGYKRLNRFEDLSHRLSVRQEFQDIRDEELSTPEKVVHKARRVVLDRDGAEYVSEVSNGQLEKDFGVITRFRTDSGLIVTWFSGNYGAGTYGAVLFATRAALLARPSFTYPSGKHKALQIVVEVTGIQGNAITERHGGVSEKFHRVHDDYERAIEKAIFG